MGERRGVDGLQRLCRGLWVQAHQLRDAIEATEPGRKASPLQVVSVNLLEQVEELRQPEVLSPAKKASSRRPWRSLNPPAAAEKAKVGSEASLQMRGPRLIESGLGLGGADGRKGHRRPERLGLLLGLWAAITGGWGGLRGRRDGRRRRHSLRVDEGQACPA